MGLGSVKLKLIKESFFEFLYCKFDRRTITLNIYNRANATDRTSMVLLIGVAIYRCL